jgi:hypothetical protein
MASSERILLRRAAQDYSARKKDRAGCCAEHVVRRALIPFGSLRTCSRDAKKSMPGIYMPWPKVEVCRKRQSEWSSTDCAILESDPDMELVGGDTITEI